MRKITKVVSGLLLSILVLFVAGLTALVVVQVDFSNSDDLDEFINTKMNAADVAGISAAIIENGHVVWQGNYGYANLATNKAVDTSTIFQIASVSKTVTGLATMQLVEQGVLDLEASINTYLPTPIVNPYFPEEDITLAMLLSHTSSIIDNDDLLKTTYTIETGLPDSDVTLEQVFQRYFVEGGEWYRADKNFVKAKPGSQYHYSNAAFGLLGYILEQATGQGFTTLTQQNIFTPLAMQDSGWLTKDIDLANMTVHYNQGEALAPYSFATYPDGALKTTVEDYARFLAAFMTHDESLISQASFDRMFTGEHNLVWEEDILDMFFIDSRGAKIHGHSGGDPGVFTLVYFNQTNQTGIVFFMNSTPGIDLRIFNIIAILKRLNEASGILEN